MFPIAKPRTTDEQQFLHSVVEILKEEELLGGRAPWVERGNGGLFFPKQSLNESVIGCVRFSLSDHWRSITDRWIKSQGFGSLPNPTSYCRSALTRRAKKITKQLLTMDILVLATMKNAAKCDT